MGANKPDLDTFLSAYPQAANVFGVSTDEIRKWAEESRFDDVSSSVLPRVRLEFSAWSRQNLLTEKPEWNNKYAEILHQHQAGFAERVNFICAFVGPKTPEQIMKDLIDLKDEFGVFPEDQMRELENDLAGKNIKSWADIPTGDQGCVLKDYFMRAIDRYGQGSIPLFDENIHLNEHFTGFVREVRIYNKRVPGWKLDVEGDFAYIKNGKIQLISNKKILRDNMDEVSFTWTDPIDPRFNLKETYGKTYRKGDVNRLFEWWRNAKFPIVTGDKNGEIEIDYGESGFYVAIRPDLLDHSSFRNFSFRKDDPRFKELYEALLNDPDFPSSIENIKRLFGTERWSLIWSRCY